MPLPSHLSRLANRTSEQARAPVKPLKPARLPRSVVKAFPELEMWEKKNDQMFDDWVRQMNVSAQT
jgi:hypothetical protein